eukprot:jgi/Tetstr1/461539/TSEL_006645.t1
MPKKGKNSFKAHCRRNKRKKPPKQAVLPKDAMTVESGSASAGATDGKPLARCKRCDFERAGAGARSKKSVNTSQTPSLVKRLVSFDGKPLLQRNSLNWAVAP